MATITKFYELNVWKKAHALTLDIYNTTQVFPTHELYGLTSQARRAASSVPTNIVEGFYRKTKKERLRFYEIAMSSLEELKYHIILSKDLLYISTDAARELFRQSIEVGKMLRGWMNTQK